MSCCRISGSLSFNSRLMSAAEPLGSPGAYCPSAEGAWTSGFAQLFAHLLRSCIGGQRAADDRILHALGIEGS